MKKTGYNIIQFSLSKELQHGMMVSILAGELARKAGLSEEQCHELSIAGLLHDIGKLEMAKYVYQKGQKPLTIEEIKYVRLHPTLGYAITSQNHYSDFIIKSILYHHENYDGSGFPSNLKEDEIPIGARILRICDVFAALISDRPYRRAFSWEKAVAIMIEEIKNFDLKLFLQECYAVEDSPNGIHSAYSAGCKVFMVPDLTQPDAEQIGRASCRERV